MKKSPKWLLYTVLSLVFLRILMAIGSIYFVSSSMEHMYWFLVTIFVLTLTWYQLKQTGRSLLLLFSLLGYTCWLIILNSIGSDQSTPMKFSNLKQKVWIREQRTIRGTTGKYTIMVGESYLGNSLFREETHFQVNFYDQYIDKKYVIPEGLNLKHCAFWKEKGYLLDIENLKCYRLKKE